MKCNPSCAYIIVGAAAAMLEFPGCSVGASSAVEVSDTVASSFGIQNSPLLRAQSVDSKGTTRPQQCPAAPEVLSDFEEGGGLLVPQGGRTGWWYVFSDAKPGTLTPPPVIRGPIEVAALPAGEQSACNRYALHATASGHPDYVGTGATLSPGQGNLKNPVDLSAYDGISFRIRSGSGSQPPVFFEMLTTATEPLSVGGTATEPQTDLYNTRGKLISGISESWQTVHIPFALLGPRYLPSISCKGFCEAPAWNPKAALGFQFSVYPQFTTHAGYDLWIDDVKLYQGQAGLGTMGQGAGNFKFPRDSDLAYCAKPAQAKGTHLIEVFHRWKSGFVVSDGQGAVRVQRNEPGTGNDTVSEGIAYGMLIAVYMNDRSLFDGLWRYWNKYPAAGRLMTWRIGGGGGSGSATDADEDAAFALIMASKQWGGNYDAEGKSLIADIWNYDVEHPSLWIKGGSQYGGSWLTNPSYFAPAYYRLFAKYDPSHPWMDVVDKSYAALESITTRVTGGLVPAWCRDNCTSAGGDHGGDEKYQYDSHRTPWRIGLDLCWNNDARARRYVSLTSDFFAQAATNGLGRLVDIYEVSGKPAGSSKPNSMSLIGTAGFGAMAAGKNHADFAARSYRFLIDASTIADPTTVALAYNYYNATVGLLTALSMSGNFNDFTR